MSDTQQTKKTLIKSDTWVWVAIALLVPAATINSALATFWLWIGYALLAVLGLAVMYATAWCIAKVLSLLSGKSVDHIMTKGLLSKED